MSSCVCVYFFICSLCETWLEKSKKDVKGNTKNLHMHLFVTPLQGSALFNIIIHYYIMKCSCSRLHATHTEDGLKGQTF